MGISSHVYSRLKPSVIVQSNQNPSGMLITRSIALAAGVRAIVRGTVLAHNDHFVVVPADARILGQGHLAIPTDALEWTSEGWLAIRTAKPNFSMALAEETFTIWVLRTFALDRCICFAPLKLSAL